MRAIYTDNRQTVLATVCLGSLVNKHASDTFKYVNTTYVLEQK